MARNGSGTFSNPYPNFVNGTVISSTEVNSNNSDIATALTQSIAVDGQTTVTANLPMNAKKFTGLAAGSAATDSLNLGQAQAEAMVWCGTAGGTADAITLAPTPAITAYAAGQRFVWKASGSVNTGATTVAVSGLGAIALQDNGSALAAGQHQANRVFMGILDTTSTVQVTQVQISGTDPLIVTSLTVSGTATIGGILSVDDTTTSTSGTTGSIHTDGGLGVAGTAFVAGAAKIVGVTTHGDDVVSDTDSTDDLGTTGVRWANTWTDTVNGVTAPTAQYTSAEETKLAGIETAADVTDATNVLAGLAGQVAAAATFEPTGDTSAGDNAAMGYTSVLGAILTGQGSTNDVTLVNDADATVLGIPTGTTDVTMAGGLAVSGGVTMATINGGIAPSYFEGKNRIHNPSGVVNQRGAQTGMSTSGYFSDRWTWVTAGTSVVNANTVSGYLEIDVTTADTSMAAGDFNVSAHYIEGYNVADLLIGTASAKTITLSFKHKHTKTGIHSVTLQNSAQDRTYVFEYTQSVSNTEETHSETITLDTTGTWLTTNGIGLRLYFGAGIGSTHSTGTTDSWVAGNFFGSSNQVNDMDSVSNFFRITDVQLEEGTIATPLEYRSFGTELALCQRYYEIGYSGMFYSSNSGGTSRILQMPMAWVVTKRASPTTVPGFVAGSGGYAGTTGSFEYVTEKNFSLKVQDDGDDAGGIFTWTASADL